MARDVATKQLVLQVTSWEWPMLLQCSNFYCNFGLESGQFFAVQQVSLQGWT